MPGSALSVTVACRPKLPAPFTVALPRMTAVLPIIDIAVSVVVFARRLQRGSPITAAEA